MKMDFENEFKKNGPSQNISLNSISSNTTTSQISFPFSMKPIIDKFYFAKNGSFDNQTFNFGEEIPLLFGFNFVEIYLKNQIYLNNISIFPITTNRTWFYPEYESYFFVNLTSSSSYSNALFPSIQIIYLLSGATSTKMNLTTFYEGNQIQIYNSSQNSYLTENYFNLNLETNVSKIEINENGSFIVKEGEIFSKPWEIIVKDNENKTIQNKPVFAKISKQCNFEISENQSPIENSKVLLNPISFTNEFGIATFSKLKFSISGLTKNNCSFKIKFISDGISIETDNIQVNSSMNRIIWIEEHHQTKIINITKDFKIISNDTWPVIQVQNEFGKGIPNKLISLNCSDFTFQPYKFITNQNGFVSLYLDFALILHNNFNYYYYSSNCSVIVDGIESEKISIGIETTKDDYRKFDWSSISKINITDWNENIKSGELINLNISIVNHQGNITLNQNYNLIGFINPGDLPMGYLIYPEEGYWNIINGTEIISTRIYGISMRTELCLVVGKDYIPDFENYDWKECFEMSLSNDIEKVEISHFPNPNQNFTSGQPFGNESIKLNITGNNISENNLTVHILALNSNNYYGKLFGRNSSETVKNESNNLYQSNYTLNGTDLILDNFIINQQSIYDSNNNQFIPFNLTIFVNGVPSNSEIPVKLCFPHQSLNLFLTWDIPITFVSGYNKIPSQPILQITDSTTGEPIQGFYAFFSILNDSGEVIDSNTEIIGDILSIAPSNETGYVTWNISFLKISESTTVKAIFWIADCEYPTLYNNSNKMEVDLYVQIEEFNWQFFDIPSQIVYNQSFPISPKVLVSNQNISESISNKYIILQMQNNSDNTQYLDIKTEITNENGIATFSNLFLDLEEGIEEINIQFVCDDKSYSQNITVLYEPTNILILSSAIDSKIGIPFTFPNQAIAFNNKSYLGSFVVQLFSFSIPISGKPITAKLISQNSENGKLDPSTSLKITDENGIAVFNLRMESGNSGNYQIKFSYLNSISITSDPIYIENPIKNVIFNKPNFLKEVAIGNTFSATIKIEFLRDTEDFENISFPINIITKCSNASGSIDNIVKKPNHEMILNNLKFDSVSGDSECLNEEGKVKAEIAFSVLGIQSNFQTILVTSPDKIVITKAIDSLKQSFLFWAVSLCLIFPFVLNSTKNHNIITFLIVIGLIIVLMVYISNLIPKPDKIETRQFVALSIFESILISLSLLILLIIILSKFIPKFRKLIEKTFFIHERISNYFILFKRLLPIGANKSLKFIEIEKEFIEKQKQSESESELETETETELETETETSDFERNKKIEKVIEEIELESDSQNENENQNQNQIQIQKQKLKTKIKYKKISELTETEIQFLFQKHSQNLENKKIINSSQFQNRIKSKNKIFIFWNWIIGLFKKLIKKIKSKFEDEPNPHQEYESYFDFYYPQRMIVSFWLWIVLVILLILLITKLIRSSCLITQLYRQQVIGNVQQNQCFEDKPNEGDYSNAISIYGVELIQELDSTYSNNPNPFPNSFSRFIYSFSRNKINQILNAISITSGISGLIAFIILLLLWRSIFKLYKKRIMLLRQGKKPFAGFDTADPVKVTSYTNLQVWLGLISFFLAWVFVFIILFIIPAIYWFISKQFLYGVFKYFIYFASTLIVYQIIFGFIAQKIMRKYFTYKKKITDRTAFSIYDFIKFFMTIISGATLSIKKLLGMGGGSILSIFRLDDKKSFDESYAAMMLIDHETNNPILRIFSNYLINFVNQKKIMFQKIFPKGINQDLLNKKKRTQLTFIEYHPISHEPIQKEKIRKIFLFLLTLSSNKNLKELRKKALKIEKRRKELKKEKEEKVEKLIEEKFKLNPEEKEKEEKIIDNQFEIPLIPRKNNTIN
ncbi:heat shock protein [Anaeramoeba ignava]|uniref:Heat shock protein n=1 Tax=Anaeramoeba ignava TaxID=1746090 RepID=A0A9Q0LVG2_ANAIG|nr:heat shock protein [Anaeramoeba ignava]